MTNITLNTINTTLEQADALIENIGMTEMVEDYELNESGHVYTLRDGSAIVVISATEYHRA